MKKNKELEHLKMLEEQKQETERKYKQILETEESQAEYRKKNNIPTEESRKEEIKQIIEKCRIKNKECVCSNCICEENCVCIKKKTLWQRIKHFFNRFNKYSYMKK